MAEEDLCVAALEGDAEDVEQLLGNGVDVNCRLQFTSTGIGDEGNTPLHAAVENGHEEVVAILIDAKADVNSVSETSGTPLHIAAREGLERMVFILLEFKADSNLQDERGTTPLHEAAGLGLTTVTMALMDANADPKAQDKDGRTPKDVAMEKGQFDGFQAGLRDFLYTTDYSPKLVPLSPGAAATATEANNQIMASKADPPQSA